MYTGIAGLFYQNDIESMHFVEKNSQCYKKTSVAEFITGLQAIVTKQQTEEIRALYGADCLQSEFKKFFVDSANQNVRSIKVSITFIGKTKRKENSNNIIILQSSQINSNKTIDQTIRYV